MPPFRLVCPLCRAHGEDDADASFGHAFLCPACGFYRLTDPTAPPDGQGSRTVSEEALGPKSPGGLSV